MKRVLIGVLVVAALGAGAYYGKDLLAKPQTLAQGASVKLVLMRQLEAGKEKEGDEVLFLVAEDVKAKDGGIAIAKGAVVKGTVTQSRGENMLSGITNRPARLAVKFEDVKTVDGQTVDISADIEGAETAEHSFTRANTGKQDVVEKLERISDDPNVKATLDQIQASFAEGKAPDFSDPKTKEALGKISKELDLKALGKAIAEDRAGEIANVMKSTGNVSDATRVFTSGSVTLGAVLELANVVGDVGGKLSRVLGGRTIRAYPGTEVPAYIARKVEVRTK
jgi:hypothetical protein